MVRRHGFAFHRRSLLTVALERMEPRHRSARADGHNPAMGGRGPAVGLYMSLLEWDAGEPWGPFRQPRGCLRDGAKPEPSPAAAACSDVEGGLPLQRRCPSACGTVARIWPD